MPGLQPEEFQPLDYNRLAVETVRISHPELSDEDSRAFYEAVAATRAQLLELDGAANQDEGDV